jgi:hypothetical protein
VLRDHHEGLPHPVGVAAGHEADTALGGPEPGLESERGLAGHGGSPQEKLASTNTPRVVAGV